MPGLTTRSVPGKCRAEYEPLVCGAILYDDPDVRTSGWISRNGGVPERFDERLVGHSDTLWLTNLPAFRIGQARLSGRFRPENWLRAKAGSLLREWGLENNPDEGVRLLSKVFGRVLAIVERTWPDLEIRNPGPMKAMEGLSELIADVLPAVRKTGDARMRKVATAAYRTYQNVEQGPRGREETRYTGFVIPRADHARKILATPVPYGPWEEFREGSPGFPADQKGRQEWLGSIGRPAVVRVVYRGSGGDPMNLILNGDNREWWTGEEVLAALSVPGSQIEIVEAHVAKGTEPSPVVLLSGGRLGGVSVSYGLFAENLWVAAAGIGTPDSRPPWTLFLRATDRMETSRVALELLGRGITVFGMGYGVVHASLPVDIDPADILDIARKTGTYACPGHPEERFETRKGDVSDTLRVIHLSSAWKALEKIDDQWWEEGSSLPGKEKKCH